MNPTNIKFYTGDSFTAYEPGGVYFETDSHLVKVAKTENDIESYSGVQSASYNDGVLTITNEFGEIIEVDLGGTAIDLCEYPSDIEEIEDLTEKLFAKANYAKSIILENSRNYFNYINSIRAKKVISKEDFLTKTFKFGSFPTEVRAFEYNQYKSIVFKVHLYGCAKHPDMRIDDYKTDLYIHYNFAWEDTDEWSIDDLVFYKKYGIGFNPSNRAFDAPKYILRLFADGDYNVGDLKRYVKSQCRSLLSDNKMGNPTKCTLQDPYINVGETSLICKKSVYRMPIYVLASDGVLYNRIGGVLTGDRSAGEVGLGSDARGDGDGRFIDPITSEIHLLSDYFLLEKFNKGTGEERYYWSDFLVPDLSDYLVGIIRQSYIPYIFLKTTNVRVPGIGAITQSDRGALIAVHVDNVTATVINNLNKEPGARYHVYVPCLINEYLGCVIKNTHRSLITSVAGACNNKIVRCYQNLDAQAWICNRHGNEFVKLKKDYLVVNPITCVRYNDPNEPHLNGAVKDVFSQNPACITRADDCYKFGIAHNFTTCEYGLSVEQFLSILADRCEYTSYVKSVSCDHIRALRWKRFMFNKIGNFRSQLHINLSGAPGQDVQIVSSKTSDYDNPLNRIHPYSQLNTWKIILRNYNALDIVANYIVTKVFKIKPATESYMYTRFGALDAMNNIKEKYVDFEIFKNYISKRNSQNLKSKHEVKGIAIRLILGNKSIPAFIEHIQEQYNAYISGDITAVEFLNNTCHIKILGDVDSYRNIVRNKIW